MPKRILLLDSSAAMHRYHHSPSAPIITEYQQRSIEITALHRYLAYTSRLTSEFSFDQLIHVLDPPNGSTYRKTIYPEYKANRQESPPEFTLQKQLLPKVLTAFSQYWVQVSGVESDDVLATLARKYAERGDLVVVVTPDKDLLQLVEDGRISVARPTKDASGKNSIHVFMDEAAVFDKLGVRPEQVADYLAIVGDDSDNIKGVHKAGPKTAAQWLEQYGDLDTLMTQASQIKGKIGERLRESLGHLPLSRKLTGVLWDVDVDVQDHPLPKINPQIVAQARALTQAKPYWPDDLGVHSSNVQTPHTSQQSASQDSTAYSEPEHSDSDFDESQSTYVPTGRKP